MDTVTQALRDPTMAEAVEEAESLARHWGGHAPTVDAYEGGVPRGTLTIDLDLPPVDAAPKPKGPKWRLQMLRESWERVKARTP